MTFFLQPFTLWNILFLFHFLDGHPFEGKFAQEARQGNVRTEIDTSFLDKRHVIRFLGKCPLAVNAYLKRAKVAQTDYLPTLQGIDDDSLLGYKNRYLRIYAWLHKQNIQ